MILLKRLGLTDAGDGKVWDENGNKYNIIVLSNGSKASATLRDKNGKIKTIKEY